MVQINGIPIDAAGTTVSAYLAQAEYDASRVAIERNQEILPRAAYDAAVLQDGDTLEIVSFVGGG